MSKTQTEGEDLSLLSTQKVDTPTAFAIPKIPFILFGVAGVAAVIALAVVAANDHNKHHHSNSNSSSTPTPTFDLVKCSFGAPFENWVDYGYNSSDISCPKKGTRHACSNDGDCNLAMPSVCAPGGVSLLRCITSSQTDNQAVCGTVASSLPDLTYPAGFCNSSTRYSKCAYCRAGACQGVAVCAKPANCDVKVTQNSKYGNYTLDCFELGNEFTLPDPK